jgi:cyclohexanone monooxygenase
VYLPLLEETGYIPTERYARGDEILEYCRKIGRHYNLYDGALLETGVTEVRWDDDEQLWTITTDRQDEFRSKFVCVTTGSFVLPKLPGVPGISSFKGKAFHTSRWDYSYTGGDGNGNLEGLRDKRVAVIGTGATSIGCIPVLAEDAQHLFVFQRTPAAVGERNNAPTDPDWVASLEPGWHRRRVESFSAYLAGEPAAEDLVRDGWTEIISRFRSIRQEDQGTDAEASMERADFDRMEQIRARVSATVKDQGIAQTLKPYYRAMCKRPCFHDEYLDVFNRDNVTLVDTDGQGIDAITERGVMAQGKEYEVDCIIFGSGFQTSGSLESRLGYEIFGRDGLALSAKWADGISTYFGMQTNGFPNLFIVSQAQVGISSNQTHPLGVQARHVAQIVAEARRRGAATVDVTVEAEQWWVQQVIQASRINMKFLESCTPSYFNNEGQPHEELFRRNGSYAPGANAFARVIDDWRAGGDWSGEVFAPATSANGEAVRSPGAIAAEEESSGASELVATQSRGGSAATSV